MNMKIEMIAITGVIKTYDLTRSIVFNVLDSHNLVVEMCKNSQSFVN